MNRARSKVLDIRLDESGAASIYLQIAEGIRNLVRSKGLAPGSILPPERVLCQHYGVSRMTLRQAFSVLEREHLIERRRGHGTFVSAGRMQKQQQEMRSFTEEIVARGGVPSSSLLSFRQKQPHRETQEYFCLPAGEPVYEIKRLRFCNDQPLALETAEIPCYLCPRLDRYNLATQSLYQILEEEYDLRLSYCIEEISAAKPSGLQRKILGIPAGSAVLVIRRKTSTANDTPVEWGTTVYRGDMYTALVRSVRAR